MPGTSKRGNNILGAEEAKRVLDYQLPPAVRRYSTLHYTRDVQLPPWWPLAPRPFCPDIIVTDYYQMASYR